MQDSVDRPEVVDDDKSSPWDVHREDDGRIFIRHDSSKATDRVSYLVIDK